MSPFQIILVVACFFFFLLAVDAYKRKKFNGIHIFFFVSGTIILLIFSLNISLLNKFGGFFGFSRGADLLVYCSIILLSFFYFELFHKTVKNDSNTTKLITKLANQQAIYPINYNLEQIDSQSKTKSNYIFLIRAYNEEKVVGLVIDEIISNGYGKILLVNDGSTDKTLEVFKEKQTLYNDKLIIILSHIMNRGPGAANKTGFEFLKNHGDKLNIKWIVTYDADGQMDINDMKSFQDAINKGKGEVFWGSRNIGTGKSLNQPFIRKLILKGSKIVTLLLNNVRISDPHNGYRVLSLDVIKKVNIYSDWMTYASELLESVNKNGYKIQEIPVTIKYTEYSLGKGQKNSSAFKILFELVYKKFFFR